MNFELDPIAGLNAIGLLSALVGGLWWLHRLVMRFEGLEKQAEHRKEDSEIMLIAMMATLDGLHQNGANGVVTKTLEELKEYIVKSR